MIASSTGLPLPDNPLFGGSAGDDAIICYGLRNPFRFNTKPGSPPPATLFIGDVGWHEFEEVNVAYGGENFGWELGPRASCCAQGRLAPGHSIGLRLPSLPNRKIPARRGRGRGTFGIR